MKQDQSTKNTNNQTRTHPLIFPLSFSYLFLVIVSDAPMANVIQKREEREEGEKKDP
jgi:hypothetical protein